MSGIPRFFVDGADLTGETALFPDDVAHHARTVLRLRVGEAVLLHDGAGKGCRATLLQVDKRVVLARLEAPFTVDTEPATSVRVCQALPKTAEKLEQVLQHGTEVGAAGFVIFPAARSLSRPPKLERWRQIVRSAAEQSGRGILPVVDWHPSLAAALDATRATRRLVLHEKASSPLSDALASAALSLWVGPEGGFADEEIGAFAAADASVVTLGPRILRTETAALVALSQALFALG